jgi:hypothetical protein
VTRLRRPEPAALAYDKPLCAPQDGFTLHAATHAGALDAAGREALLRYVLRPPVAQDKIEHRPDGLVRIVPKKPYADGTVAVDMDPLSLLSRLAVEERAVLARVRDVVAEAGEPLEGVHGLGVSSQGGVHPRAIDDGPLPVEVHEQS